MSNDIILKNFSVSGYRSFGPQTQEFSELSKINIFIGQNNSGKSNIIKIISEIIPNIKTKTLKLDPIDRNQKFPTELKIGIKLETITFNDGTLSINTARSIDPRTNLRITQIADNIIDKIKKQSGSDSVWYVINENGKPDTKNIINGLSQISDHDLYDFWAYITQQSGGSRAAHWEPETAALLHPAIPSYSVVVVPAFRKISASTDKPYEFDGQGIIKELAELQNPELTNRDDLEKFNKINHFLQEVTENKSARIEIPHKRETILVHMDEKILPIDSLGTGIHEVIMLAATSTILNDHVICIEEPEVHLNPILQKRLLGYLKFETHNQYFITTHSPAIMDTEGAEIFHVRLNEGTTHIARCSTNDTKRTVCHDLGYRPSDLLQANCIIWVEGPSDRIYLNYWLRHIEPTLIEGIHYSIMFYGGRLASHLSGNDIDDFVEDFISLKRLNRNLAILIDSDKRSAQAHINATKKRLKHEFEENGGLCWITAGREIENYFPCEQIETAISKTKPSAKLATANFGKYDNPLKIITKSGKESQASKTDVARYIVENYPASTANYDLRKRIEKLVEFIRSSNSNA